MNYIKNITNGVYCLILIFLVIVFLAIIFSLVRAPGGISLFIVQSGSMEPSVKTGSLALTQNKNEYFEGEIVTFIPNSETKMSENRASIMHRIVAETKENGKTYFTTKGDANQGNDPEPVTKNQILGKVLITIPYAGYAVSYARTIPGFMFLIVVPAVVIVLMELTSIVKEIKCMTKTGKIKLRNIQKIKAVKIFILLVFVFYLSILKANSISALFSDKEISINATISTGKWGKKPQLVCEFNGERNMFHFGFFNHGEQFKSLSYLFKYDSDNITQSVMGNNINIGEIFEEDIYLGYCSEEICTPHSNVENFILEIEMDGQKKMGCRWMWQKNRWSEF